MIKGMKMRHKKLSRNVTKLSFGMSSDIVYG
jgi:uncharacterized pyridoxal phosphate-containing UPF0001 family protein